MRTLHLTRLTTVAFVAVGVLLALPSDVVAAKPVVNEFSESYTFTVPPDQNPCGVALQVVGEARFTERIFFDKAGNLVKVVTHFHETWTETGPSGTVYGKSNGSHTQIDFVFGEGSESWVSIIRGLPIKYSAPGFGVIVRDAGSVALQRTVVFNGPGPADDEFSQTVIFEHGPHDTKFDDWIPEYCDVLAG